jgi:hypothetical protein
MESRSIELNEHEEAALRAGLEKYIVILDDQIMGLKSAKHLGNDQKKELHNTLGKRKDLLRSILQKL